MTTSEPTTGEIVEILRRGCLIVQRQAADRLESQEKYIAELEEALKPMIPIVANQRNKIIVLTARAEQAEAREKAAVTQIERLKSKQVALCSICEFEDMIGCVHKNHCDGFQLFKRRGQPQDGGGK